jgi:hypothetical protein
MTAELGNGCLTAYNGSHKQQVGLEQYIAWFPQRAPTPTVDGNYNRKGLSKDSGDGLATFVRKLPTPCATDHKTGYPDSPAGRAQRAQRAKPLRDTAAPGGQLNPTWVEWLMGWPLGWTDCAASATARYQPWCASHGIA